jgi:hypothetical protein
VYAIATERFQLLNIEVRHFGSLNVLACKLKRSKYSAFNAQPDCMHRCLAIDEILRCIVRSFGHDGMSSKVALACTSRNFQQVALDSLWFFQTSLIPLFKCLPRDTWSETDDTDDDIDDACLVSNILCWDENLIISVST